MDVAVYPLDFYEYLRFKDRELPHIELREVLPGSVINEVKDESYKFLLFGGIPAVVLEGNVEEKKEMLKGIYSSYIQKGIKGLIGQGNILHFNDFDTTSGVASRDILVVDEIVQKLTTSRYQIKRAYLF